MTNPAQNPSQATENTKFFSLYSPTDRNAPAYTFDTLEAARAFKQQHCLSAYQVAYVEWFDAVENGGVFA